MRVTVISLWGKGGPLQYISQLGNSLERFPDIELTFILPKGADLHLFSPSIAIEYVDVMQDDSPNELLKAPLKLLKMPQFFRTIQRTKPDVIHVNDNHVWFIPTLPLLKKWYPIVATIHDVNPHPGQDDSWRKRMEMNIVARSAHRFFVHGDLLKQQLLAKYSFLSADNVSVLPYGDHYHFAQEETNAVEEEWNVLFFGRIRLYKGLDYFIKAANLVAQRMPETRFVIVGSGDFRPYRHLLSDTANFEIHNRFVSDSEVASFFGRSSIVVLPYVEGSRPGVLVVAWAFKKPIVATRVGILPEVVEDGKTGLLIPPRDVTALADAILRLLNNHELRKTLGRNAYEKMKRELGWEKVAAATVSVYEAAILESR